MTATMTVPRIAPAAPRPAAAMAETRAVTFARGSRTVLDAVDFAAFPGTFTAIVGPNGAGKSTLLKLMAGEHRPGAGTVLIDGVPLAVLGARRAAMRRAVLPQATSLSFPFNVREIAALGITVPGFVMARGEVDDIIDAALERVDLTDKADRLYDALSGGERQRAQLARVLCQSWAGERQNGPGLLMLDEPTAAQDLAHQLRVLDAARDHARGGGAAIVVLHDLNLAARYADRMVVIAAGRKAAEGPPSEVLTLELLRTVFAVHLPPSTVPPDGCPFILPQIAERL
ncbi:heme ABC transporter ATP-binding protein [Pseudoxanthobacter sp.]|uniref:heme ABC transporter ATP-binding protein n=1 Tax=Pseudoxanthobacter sp. TaxID=1925742 RepID=UPI002FE1D08A